MIGNAFLDRMVHGCISCNYGEAYGQVLEIHHTRIIKFNSGIPFIISLGKDLKKL